ncbi:MAG: hypothetical protein HQK55_08210 [Deltaproteobacteria bacterium]|nr:hypothetical protein [Deltaproteobacteria bacterium]
MPKRDMESYQGEILEKLRAVGRRGTSKSSLVGANKPALEALKELIQKGVVVNIGSGKTPLYLLQEFDNPLELACEAMEQATKAGNHTVFTDREILQIKTSTKPIKSKLAEARTLLVKEGKLVGLKGKKTLYYAHSEVLRSLLPVSQPSMVDDRLVAEKPQIDIRSAASSFSGNEVLAAYTRLKLRHGYSNVEIYELGRESGQDSKELQAFLLEESRQGRAVLSLGDWSLSKPEYQAAAVYLDGQPHLLVRFKS